MKESLEKMKRMAGLFMGTAGLVGLLCTACGVVAFLGYLVIRSVGLLLGIVLLWVAYEIFLHFLRK